MEDRHLVDSLTEALRAGGFTGIQTRTSSRSVTLSGRNGQQIAIVHIEDQAAPSGPQNVLNPNVPDARQIAVRPQVTTLAVRSGSGVGSTARSATPNSEG